MSRHGVPKRLKVPVYRFNQHHAQSSFAWPTTQMVHLSSETRCVCEEVGPPLTQFLDESTLTWQNLVDESMYADQDVWENVAEVEVPEVIGAKRYVNSDAPMRIWVGVSLSPGFREEYLRELLRAEGRAGLDVEQCPTCANVSEEDRDWDRTPVIKCDECGTAYAFALHQGTFFEDSTLKDHGLRVQLGHATMKCCNPLPAMLDFTVLHINSIHKVAVDFCGCLDHVPLRVQCLQFNWYLVTSMRPWSCATMEVLKHFHTLTLAGKIIPRSICQRGHVLNGIATTEAGHLSLHCLSCPRLGFNLPKDWKTATPKEERMSNCDKSNVETDPGLHTGLAYFVNYEDYLAHISSCSGFRTLVHVESKCNKGLHATGIGICVCTRHEMVLPLMVGDLQVGERYCNMDYIAGSASKAYDGCDEIFLSYDIACQWKAKLRDRMKKLPAKAQFRDDMVLDFGVPKLHCKAHKYACQCQFSMNLKRGVARTDGEGVEQTWDDMNTCTSSTKEMGPGARHDTIDDQFGGHNWRKITSTDKNWAQEWTKQVEAWESNYEVPNPYFKEAKLQEDADSVYAVCGSPLAEEAALTTEQRMEGCKGGVVKIEEELREAQCLDVLDVVWGIIRAQRDSYTYHDRNMWGQVHMTRAIAFIEHLGHQLDGAVAKYNTARAALLCLRGSGEWKRKLRVLMKADVSSIEGAVFMIDDGMEPDIVRYRKKKKTTTQQVVEEGEGFRAVSWIWTMKGSFDGMEDKEMNTVVHVEWLKSRAWMHQWHEELVMVKTEMGRTLVSLEHNACNWEHRCNGMEDLEGDTDLQEGRHAYVESQAATWRCLAASFQVKWLQSWAAISALRPPWTVDKAIKREATEEAGGLEADAEMPEMP
ncbi:hypothetical protein ARMSODRAFT_977475 [Armillaria solidipes]|uniref:CxC2-like cysteine cluster KDZ transposase-associated domain-containing protein n=1 Tax=Armillaria solidipes TaxID=1076256 RepID=A0A2H3BRS7_9AGAR|nr:hypothetical protein ARMSODRAFT_977475 [Armillaria solidipes]